MPDKGLFLQPASIQAQIIVRGKAEMEQQQFYIRMKPRRHGCKRHVSKNKYDQRN